MLAALVALLALQGPPTREEIRKLVDGLPATHAELVRAGRSAMRLLAEMPRTEALAKAMFDLKCAGAPEAIRARLEQKSGVAAAPFPLPEIEKRFGIFVELPMVVDLGLPPEKREREVKLREGRVDEVLCGALWPVGLDYAVVRGRVVVSTPERLWSGLPEAARRLTEEQRTALQSNLKKLSEDDVQSRDHAWADIAALGRSALPYLEEELRVGRLGAEARRRVVDLERQIRRREAPARFDRSLALEMQACNDLDRVALRTLRDKSATLEMEGTLSGALALLTKGNGFEVDAPEEAGRSPVVFSWKGIPLLEALYFLLASFDLDACLVGGRLRIGTPSEIARLLR